MYFGALNDKAAWGRAWRWLGVRAGVIVFVLVLLAGYGLYSLIAG